MHARMVDEREDPTLALAIQASARGDPSDPKGDAQAVIVLRRNVVATASATLSRRILPSPLAHHLEVKRKGEASPSIKVQWL